MIGEQRTRILLRFGTYLIRGLATRPENEAGGSLARKHLSKRRYERPEYGHVLCSRGYETLKGGRETTRSLRFLKPVKSGKNAVAVVFVGNGASLRTKIREYW